MTTPQTTTTRYEALVRKVYAAFFSPARYEVKSADREILDWGSNYDLAFAGGKLAVTTWGTNGPTALLMHGWGGARAQMTGLVDPLLFAGYRVVAFDQPAHGDSDGTTTNLLEIAPTLDLIAEHEGPFDVILAHSFGTLITSYALVSRNFPAPARLVYFGAFNRLLESLPRFQRIAGVSVEIMEGMRAMMNARFGQDVLEAIVNEWLVPHIHIPALMFHDRSDNVTPIEDSRAIARAWPGVRYVETDGLGHRGALQSREVHEQVSDFLKS